MRGHKVEVVVIDEEYSSTFLEIESERLFVLILVFLGVLHFLIDSQGTFRWTLLCSASSSFLLLVALLCWRDVCLLGQQELVLDIHRTLIGLSSVDILASNMYVFRPHRLLNMHGIERSFGEMETQVRVGRELSGGEGGINRPIVEQLGSLAKRVFWRSLTPVQDLLDRVITSLNITRNWREPRLAKMRWTLV